MEFDKILSETYPWMLRVAKKYCSCVQDAEDLAGETVCKLLVNRDRFDHSKDIKPWCLAIMQNTFITMYNRSSLVRFVGYSFLDTNVYSPYCTSSLTILNDIKSAIQRCADKSRSIDSVIYCAEGYSYEEISKRLNIPVGTVRSRIAYGRDLILKELGHKSVKKTFKKKA